MLVADSTYEALVRLADECAARGRNRLPTERDLAVRLHTSRTTVRKALDRLEQEGRIERVRGRAGGAYLTQVQTPVASSDNAVSFLTSKPLRRDLNTVLGVPEMLREQGFRDGTKVLDARRTTASEATARALEVNEGDPVISVQRLRFADGAPLSLEQMYLAARCAGILQTQLLSVYRDLRKQLGITVSSADEIIELAAIADAEAPLLEQPVGAPVLKLSRVGFDQNDDPVEYSVDLFRADRTQLHVRTASLP